MKKRIITSMAVVAMLVAPVAMYAQNIYLDNEELAKSMRGDKEGEGENAQAEITPDIVDMDQFAPLGEGIMLLSCLGGAYLLGRRRKEQNS